MPDQLCPHQAQPHHGHGDSHDAGLHHIAAGSCSCSERDVVAIVARAKAICAQQAIRWTSPREQVLTVLAQAAAPLTAYAILDKVSHDYQRVTNAPSVYRALETLCDIGVVLSVGSTGRYMICHHPGEHSTHLFLVCRCCGHVHELHLEDLEKTIGQQLKATGFAAQKQVIEVLGLCQTCQDHK